MKLHVIILLLLPTLCIADALQEEKELWRGYPLERLPLHEMHLLVKYDSPRFWGIPERQYRMPHKIAVGMQNVGTNAIGEFQILFSFTHGKMFLRLPSSDILTLSVLPGGFRGCPSWSAINPGESTFFVPRPLWEWFPAITNAPDGQFCFWWTIGTKESDRLILNKAGLEITKKD